MNPSFNQEVGMKLRNARKAKRFSLQRLGELVRLHASTVSRYEKGEINSLDIEKLKEFAKVLDVSVAYLMGWDDEPHPHRIRKSMSLEEFAQEFGIAGDLLDNSFSFFKQWYEQVGEFNFDEEETKEIINFVKYLISKRRVQK